VDDEPAAIQAGTRLPRGAGPPVPATLTLREAVDRGLTHNLTLLGVTHAVEEARGQQAIARSALLPSVTGELSAVQQEVNLTAIGVRIDSPLPGVTVPDVSGPFGVVDVRARLTQAVLDLAALHTYRAARETLGASRHAREDMRDLIAHAIGAAYLDTMAARARLQATRAQLDTATAIHQRAVEQQAAGLATELDVKRAQVQTLTERQRLVALEADLTKRKIALARLVGLPPSAQYELAQELAFAPAAPPALDAAVALAIGRRSDLRAAEARLRAAERTHEAARATRLPSLVVNADYGANRSTGNPLYRTFAVIGGLRVPLWQGGRAGGEVDRTAAALHRRRAEIDDLRASIEADVRAAFVDLETAATQVEVARATVELVRESLALARQRFEVGLADNVAVVQAQQALAAAELDAVTSLVAHDLAKLELLRTIGSAAEDLASPMQVP
jgi:outer membrane protein TolC